MTLNLVRFAHWTLRDKAAQRRLALRCDASTLDLKRDGK